LRLIYFLLIKRSGEIMITDMDINLNEL